MAKILIGLAIVAAVLLIARLAFNRSAPLPHALLSSSQLAPYFQGLRDSRDDSAFVIVTVKGSEDFLQFQDSGKGILADFPLVTERQQSLEATAREAFIAEGFVVDEKSSRTNGSIISTARLTPDEAAATVDRLLQRIFGVDPDVRVKVEWSGFTPTAA